MLLIKHTQLLRVELHVTSSSFNDNHPTSGTVLPNLLTPYALLMAPIIENFGLIRDSCVN